MRTSVTSVPGRVHQVRGESWAPRRRRCGQTFLHLAFFNLRTRTLLPMLYTKVFVRVVHIVCPCYPRAGCRVYVRNRHLEAVQLRVLEKMPMPFDVAFFVLMRQRELKAADRAERPEGGEMPMLVLFVIRRLRLARHLSS